MGCLWQVYKALSVFFFTLFLILVLLGLVLLAASGIVEVPGLSALFADDASVAPTQTAIVQATATAQSNDGATGQTATPEASASGTPAAVSEETAAIQRAEDAVKAANEPGRFTIEVADTDLTALLGEVIASLDSPPVTNLVITFEQDAFVASGTVTSPFRASVQARGHFVVGEETVSIEFTEAKLGALAMPKALRDQLAIQANEFVQSNVGTAQGLRIDNVEIVPGKIIVTGERLE
jgi:hypothetical protein